MGGVENSQKQQQVIIPDTGAAKYWYVDPRVYQSPEHEDQGESELLQALKRLGIFQPYAEQGTYQF